jgi:hypothetical protein
MSALSAVHLLELFAAIAAVYAICRSLLDWKNKEYAWAIVGFIVAAGGATLSLMKLPLFEAQVEVSKS